ncbi:MAG: hypothetical protein C4337_04400 [Armatimonadota bacterium]
MIAPVGLETPEAIGEWLVAQRCALIERLSDPKLNIRDWMLDYSRVIDCALNALYHHAYKQTVSEMGDIKTPPIAILATGGYGRQELAPASDIDLTFVPINDHDPFTERLVKHLFQLLMGVLYTHAHLKVGYAYRLVEDCESLDEKTRTGLLDMRFVGGDGEIAESFQRVFWCTLDPTGFVLERYQEYQARWARWGEGILRAEPDLKEGCGGLRDRHTLNWMTQARFGVTSHQVLESLCAENLLTSVEAEALESATQRLLWWRALLHGVGGEAREQLTLTKQARIAKQLGWTREQLAQSLYPTLETHARLTQRAIERLVRAPLVLGIGLDSVNMEITPAPALERESPEWCLWVFVLAQRYRLRLSPAIEERIEATLRNAPPPPPHLVGQCLQDLFRRSGWVYRMLEPMARTGVLSWAMPLWRTVMALPAGDPTHEFTVGEHTLQAIRILDSWHALSGRELWHTVLEQLSRPEVLYMALLLHDIGKCHPERPHAEVGAELAEVWLTELGWDDQARADVVFLVRHHLLMAQTARQRDLHLPETIREFTRIVDSVERLQMLYLLTCADTQAVGERIWTPAQASFLQELYRRSLHALEAGMPTETVAVGALRKRLMRALARHPLPQHAIEQHIAQMPSGYLLNTTPDQISLHIHYVQRVRQGEGPVIEFHNAPESPYTELTLCTFDDPQPGLLSKIAGVLYAHEVEVSSARVLTREDAPRVALDTLWLTLRHRPLTLNQCAIVERDLRKVLQGEQSVADLLRDHQKDPNAPLVVHQVQFHENASDCYTVIDFQTPLDAGALYRASYALSRLGWNIHSARLGHWAGRTLLSFYCTDAYGNKIAPSDYALLEPLIASRGKDA